MNIYDQLKQLWEKVLALTKKVDAIDVEIPPHAAGDAGKYLGVDSSGDLEFSNPFPATTDASTGDVLGLVGENKVKGWITPFTPIDYSTTEQNTGVKWIDGKTIYSKTFEIQEDLVATSPTTKTINLLDLSIDEIIYFKGITCRKDSDGLIIYDLSDQYSSTDHSQFRIVKKNNIDANYSLTYSTGNFGGGHFTLFYTKTEPTLTKKKTTKK